MRRGHCRAGQQSCRGCQPLHARRPFIEGSRDERKSLDKTERRSRKLRAPGSVPEISNGDRPLHKLAKGEIPPCSPRTPRRNSEFRSLALHSCVSVICDLSAFLFLLHSSRPSTASWVLSQQRSPLFRCSNYNASIANCTQRCAQQRQQPWAVQQQQCGSACSGVLSGFKRSSSTG